MDYIEFVVGFGRRMEDVKSRCNSIDAFVRRAEDFPSLVAQEGLVAAMTFYYSKAEGRVVSPEDVKKDAEKDVEKCKEVASEGGGYSIYLDFLIEALREFGGLKCEGPLNCILEVRRNEALLTRLLLPILIEMKKVANIVGGG